MQDREFELKFEVEPGRASEVASALAARARPSVNHLAATYFDTPDQALRRAGYSLRVRQEGGRWRQTVKSLAGGPARGEWESDIDGPAPAPDLVRTTPAGAALDGAALEPLFRVDVERRSVTAEAAKARVEASLDSGRAVAPDREAEFGELELELKSGAPASLFALARRLRRELRLRPSFAAKAERGFALLDAPAEPGRHWRSPDIGPQMSAGAAFQAIAVAALAQMADNAGQFAASDHPEIVHQLRVGARRLRSAMKVFTPVIADSRCAPLEGELEWLASELDGARNLDVLLAGAVRRAGRSKNGARLAALKMRLAQERERAYARARAAAASDRFSTLLFDLLAWSRIGPWTSAAALGAKWRDAGVTAFAVEALEDGRAEVRRRGRGFGDLSARGRHKLRIRAKRLRYAAEDLRGLFPGEQKTADRFISRLKALLDCLGELNDIATATTLLEPHDPPKRLQKRERRREARLLAKAEKAFDAVADAPRFWPKQI
ncbi:MAG TPA: CHAD domain-containing protein [Caulobacteraceae bacterium]|nr:CHAD domain-containing protein [Caulobacteraceae bacterium]